MTLSCDLYETTKHESSIFEPFRNLLLHAASIWVVSGTRIDWKGFQEPIPLASSNGDALQGSTRSTNEIKKDLYLLTITNSELLLILVSSSCYHLQKKFHNRSAWSFPSGDAIDATNRGQPHSHLDATNVIAEAIDGVSTWSRSSIRV
jgi:hypothetical protein